MKEPILVFGTGALALGFLGPMLAGDYDMVFCDLDVKKEILELLRNTRRYQINICSETAVSGFPVTGVHGLNLSDSRDKQRAQELLHNTQIIFTAVGSRGIDETLDFIGNHGGRKDMFVFLCENDRRIRDRWSGKLGETITLCETIMGRMCRVDAVRHPYEALGAGLDRGVVAEDYSGLPVTVETHRRAGLKGKAWQPMSEEEFEAGACLKLFGHNGSHAYLSYLGALDGLTYFHEAGAELRSGAEALLNEEVVPAVLHRYGHVFDRRKIASYASALIGRITRMTFGDTVERGIRNSWDKIAAGERLIEGARFILAHGSKPACFCRIIAAGIRLNRPRDLSSGELDAILSEHCGIREKELISLIKQGIEELT